MSAQPIWKTLTATDYSRIEIDTTGVYPPEMEIAQEYSDDGIKFEVFRFSLDRLKVERGYLVPFACDAKEEAGTRCPGRGWPHPLHQYEEWFAKDLGSVATSHGTTEEELKEALCSEDPKERAWAYESIGGHHGFANLDHYPLTLTEDELDARWAGVTK